MTRGRSPIGEPGSGGGPDAATPEPTGTSPATPPADDKDWTWVLNRPCPKCGFDAQALPGADIAGLVRTAAARWHRALDRDDVRARPSPQVWSVLEYGCHVRDVCRIFDVRARSMLNLENPRFENWDQDATALAERYWTQGPADVAAELVEAAERLAATYDAVGGAQWTRPGRRSNGSTFTVLSLGRYLAHDLAHHLHDIEG